MGIVHSGFQLATHHTLTLCGIVNRSIALVEEVQMLSTRFDNLN